MAAILPAAYFDDVVWTTATTTGSFVTVEVEQGVLRGQEKKSKFFPDKKYYSFEGVPYAKPPEGPLRFKDPEEPEPWTGVRDTIGEEPQPLPKVERGTRSVLDQFTQPPKATDDCLYLDVDTPQVGEGKKPVLVWIHPMCFTEESSYGPQYFGVGHYMAEDVVLVTVRYRPNVLGFLYLDHEEVPGNAGLKDQVMALKWIQRNIDKFGGDPNSVTLYGFGITASFVHYHLLSPLSLGLFHRVIIQGDCALNPHSFCSRSGLIKKAFKLGKELGRETESINDLLEFLKAVPATDLVNASKRVLDPLMAHFTVGFMPCVEEPITDNSFLCSTPIELIETGQFAKVPTIMGVTNPPRGLSYGQFRDSGAGTNIPDAHSILKQNEAFSDLAKERGIQVDSKDFAQGLETVNKFFSMDKQQTIYQAEYSSQKLLYEVSYIVGFDEAVRTQLLYTEEPVYAFEFKMFSTENPMTPLIYGDTITMYEPNHVYDRLIKMWTTFAKTSNPNFDGIQATWEPVRKDSFCYLEIEDYLHLVRKRVAEESLKMFQKMREINPFATSKGGDTV